MKKILTFLMAFTITTSGATATIGCSTPTKTITTEFEGGLVVDKNDNSKNIAAYNGGGNTFYSGQNSLAQLSKNILNLLTFTQNNLTKPAQIEGYRKTFVGKDENGGNKSKQASVDGIYFKGFDGTREEFYSRFNKTPITSLKGLYDLSLAKKDGVLMPDELNESINLGQKLTEGEGQEFMNSLLTLSGPAHDSSFINQSFSVANPSTSGTKLDSNVVAYNISKEDTTDFPKGTIDIAKKASDQNQNFVDLNTGFDIGDDSKNSDLGNKRKEYFSTFILPTTEIVPDNISFDNSWEYDKDNKEQEVAKSNAPGAWNIGFDPKANEVEYKNPEGETKKVSKGQIQNNKTVLVPIENFTITYTFDSNIRDENSTKYKIAVTFANLYAKFNLYSNFGINYKTGEEEPKEHDYNVQAKWIFSGYQFNDEFDYSVDSKRDEPNHGYFSGIQISDLEVNKQV